MALAQIAAFVDSFPGDDTFLGKPVLLPQQLTLQADDLLIITARHTDAISRRCTELGITASACLYLKNHAFLQDRNASCSLAKELLGETLLQRLLPKQRMIATPAQLSTHVLPDAELSNDYVRLATLELLCKRIAAVPGATAELGVYRGFFARCIQWLLPERTIYLFDSFAGFLPEAGAAASFQAAHANITAEAVLQNLPYPENAVLKPGFFPDSLDGLEEQFCLVSLDVDFEQTTLEGLRYFWPRINTGGYLLLHDWGNPCLPGVAQALAQFEAELGHRLPAVPLSDVGGTLVLCKTEIVA